MGVEEGAEEASGRSTSRETSCNRHTDRETKRDSSAGKRSKLKITLHRLYIFLYPRDRVRQVLPCGVATAVSNKRNKIKHPNTPARAAKTQQPSPEHRCVEHTFE